MSRVVLTLVGIALAATAGAHQLAFTDVRVELASDGTYRVDVTCDLDALALGMPSSADSEVLVAEIDALDAEARQALKSKLAKLLERRLRVRFDGDKHDFEVSFPNEGQPSPAGIPPSALGLVARLSGQAPEGATHISFFASRAFPPVRLRVVHAGQAPGPINVLGGGEQSPPIPLSGPQAPPTLAATFARFVRLGVAHILPAGMDHVLFVLGLALLSPHLLPLLAQVTAFTAAHTLTLALSSYGVVRLAPEVVEPMIALSIVYVGVENAVAPQLRRSRLALVFGFGLIHGLGFAGVLGELGLPEGQRLTALLGFNVGVELGQLAVIAGAATVMAVWSRAGRERRLLVRPASLAIAAVGLFWALQRLVA